MRLLVTVSCVGVLVCASGCVRRVLTVPADAQLAQQQAPPPGMAEVQIVSEDEAQPWTVSSGGQAVCATPCTQWVSTSSVLRLRSPNGDRADAPRLIDAAPNAKRVVLIAEGSSFGEQANGITFTTLGGMGVIIAITLSAIGCGDVERRAGLCTAGLITGAVSLPLTAISILMILDAQPRVHVLPVVQLETANGRPPVTMALTPVGVAGTF